MVPMNAGTSVAAFRAAVTAAWPAVTSLVEPGRRVPLLDDWLQAMWEMLVEASLSVHRANSLFLETYGEGADCNPRSSRVYSPNATATHAIRCVPRVGTAVPDALSGRNVVFPDGGLPLDRFVCLDGAGWYSEAPPFDHMLLFAKGTEFIVSVDRLDFQLGPPIISDS